MPSSATVRGSSARVVRTVRWAGVEPSETIATGVVPGPAVLDQRRGDGRRGVHAHQDDDGAAQPAERRPVDQRVRMTRRQVPRDDDELVGQPAVGDRDAGQRGDGDRAGDAGDHLDGDARGHAGLELLHAAAEHERIAALEPHDPLAGERVLDQQRVDLLLRHRAAPRQLRGVDDLDVGGQRGEQRLRRQVVGHDDVGLRDRPAAAHGDQSRIARAHRRRGRRSRAARRPGCGTRGRRCCRRSARRRRRPGSRSPAAGRRPRARRRRRRRAARSPASRRSRPAGRRRGRRRSGRPLGLLADRRVHGGVVGGGHGVPGAVEVAAARSGAGPR